ncbi:MAG: coproporphyrinogen III oxidase family protein [Planctomycetes bacterium]|nr:coproporphyrinogen III oxidase family protein [Planctomycetota bacterium]
MELDVLAAGDRTEPGSYFVANYPPFSLWTREQLPAADVALRRDWRSAEGGTERGSAPPPLGLYLHIPFCRKRCKFCYFRVYTDKNAADVDQYMDALANEIALYKDRPRLAGRQFEFVYFGGGTPSYLSNEQLKRLVERINRHWRWDAAREVTFECEPGTLKRSKIDAIREIGVTRLSLGIEHWDDEILERNGRAHRSTEIAIAYEWARGANFDQINVDLIAGMVGETEDKWKLAVDKTLALSPDSVTIYQMELPFNTVFTKEMHDAGGTALVADWATKRRWVAYAFEQFERQGYVVSSGYTLVRAKLGAGAAGRFVYRDALWHGGDMVGAGVASFSHVDGVHFQNEDRWENYLARVSAGEMPLARALRPSSKQLLIRELILQCKYGRLDLSYFREKFGVDVRSEFAEAFVSLIADGFASVDGDHVAFSREGLLRVDSLLPRFFEPEHRGVRYT